MSSQIVPELWLAANAGRLACCWRHPQDRFNALSFKYARWPLFGAAALSLMFYQGGEAFGGLVKKRTQ